MSRSNPLKDEANEFFNRDQVEDVLKKLEAFQAGGRADPKVLEEVAKVFLKHGKLVPAEQLQQFVAVYNQLDTSLKLQLAKSAVGELLKTPGLSKDTAADFVDVATAPAAQPKPQKLGLLKIIKNFIAALYGSNNSLESTSSGFAKPEEANVTEPAKNIQQEKSKTIDPKVLAQARKIASTVKERVKTTEGSALLQGQKGKGKKDKQR